MAKVAFTKNGAVKMIDLTNTAQVSAIEAEGWTQDEKPKRGKAAKAK